MPVISTKNKQQIQREYNAIAELKRKCESCKRFLGKEAELEYIYYICNEYTTENGPALLAVADFGDKNYAIYDPEYLTDKQLVVFEFLLRDIEDNDRIVVFSKRGYNAIKKYNRNGKKIDIKLCV